MDIPIDIENSIKRFKKLKNDEKAEIITSILNEIASKKDKNGKNILEKYFDTKNIIIQIEKVINKDNGKRGNARSDIINGNKIIFFDEAKVGAFYSALLKINKRVDLNDDEVLAISYYIHEYIHHLQKRLWKIDITDYYGKIAYIVLETLTEVLTRRLTINFLSDIYKNRELSYFKEIFNRKGAYKKTTDYFNKFFDDLDRKDIFDKIGKMLQTIDDPNDKDPKENIVESLLVIINERLEKVKKLHETDIVNILVGEKTLSDILERKIKES